MPATPPPNRAALLLTRQLGELSKKPVEGFSVGLEDESNVFVWDVVMFGQSNTIYDGGILKAKLTFPSDYPNSPPKMQFVTPMWHPNIYPDGQVCISILHAPGDDQYGYESAAERWSPVQTVETIVVSVMSLLEDKPNTDSPANVDAAKDVRENYTEYKKKVRRLCRKSAEDYYG